MAILEKVDVVIVGAGASGSLFASVLAKAGKKVVLLESGPDWQMSDLISSDFWGRRVKPAGIPFLLEGKNPYGYAYQAGWGVGGAALHYFANFPRYLPNDFKVKSEHNRGLDWPVSYADLAPYYDKVAQEIGVSGDAKAEEIWRPKGERYPMPPMKTFRNGQVWLKGLESAGIRMVPAAVGMNSTEFKGRPACLYDGWCHVGCPIGALANPVVTYLADARKAGAEVRALSTVTRVLTNDAGNKVTGVEYYDARKEKQVQEARVVILAAWSAQNPRLMMISATDKHPKGLANSSGLLGKYMMAHYASGTWALFDEDVEPHMGTIGAQYMSYDRYDKTSKKGAFGSTYIVAGTALKTSDLGGFANARIDLFGQPLLTSCSEPSAASPGSPPSARKCRMSRTVSNLPTARTSSVCLSRASSTVSIRMQWRCGTQTLKRDSQSPRQPAPRNTGPRAVTSRPFICSAAPSWEAGQVTRSPTATVRLTKFQTCGSRDQACFRPRALRTRLTRSSQYRSAERSSSSQSGERWLANLSVICVTYRAAG